MKLATRAGCQYHFCIRPISEKRSPDVYQASSVLGVLELQKILMAGYYNFHGHGETTHALTYTGILIYVCHHKNLHTLSPSSAARCALYKIITMGLSAQTNEYLKLRRAPSAPTFPRCLFQPGYNNNND